MKTATVLEASALTKSFGSTTVLDGVDIALRAGRMEAVMGASGCGKTTLLTILGLLEPPDTGSLRVAGTDVDWTRESSLRRLRARRIGYVFQESLLDPVLTAQENVEATLRYSGAPRATRAAEARASLARVAMDGLADRRVHGLSGGERQRVAIARALAHQPAVVICDEPTGALDEDNTAIVVDLLREVSRDGTSVLVVTHDEAVGRECDVVHRLRRGRLAEAS